MISKYFVRDNRRKENTKIFLLTINSVYEPVASDAEILMLQHVGFMYILKLSVPQTHAIWRISEVLPTGEERPQI